MARKIDRFSDCLIHRSATSHTSALLHASVVVNLIAPAWAAASNCAHERKFLILFLFVIFSSRSIAIGRDSHDQKSEAFCWRLMSSTSRQIRRSIDAHDVVGLKKWKWKRFFMPAVKEREVWTLCKLLWEFSASLLSHFATHLLSCGQRRTKGDDSIVKLKKVTLNSHQ